MDDLWNPVDLDGKEMDMIKHDLMALLGFTSAHIR